MIMKKMRQGLAGSMLALVAAVTSAWAFSPAPRYRVVDLGTLGGSDSAALAINDEDQVVGWADTVDGSHHAFLYSDGVMQDLQTLAGGVDSYATALNQHGQVAGYSSINAFGPQFPEIYQGFIWDQDGMKSLGALFCPCSYNDRYGKSSGRGINDHGWVTGDSETARGNWVVHAMLWHDGTLDDLGGGAGDWSISRLFGINDDGVAVGDYAPDAGVQQVFDREASLWRDGVRTGLGTLPGYNSSTALAVNARGAVVGWSGTYDGTSSHAFLWRDSSMHDLGALRHDSNSVALAVNDSGEVVGWSGGDALDGHAFLWRAGRMFDLNEAIPEYSGWTLRQASGINRRGDIVGTGIHDGQSHAFLLLAVNPL
ncbi:MAG TPA: hypothetical protein VLV87_08025 [Gammaproteobacteria bacterium]|nr:hypothetical protein [Gammaproteobacteria bacterium]